MPRYVKKRDTSIESFDSAKIRNALMKSLIGSSRNSTISPQKIDIDVILNDIMKEVSLFSEETIDIEQIQDIVEKTLMKHECYAIAKHYILYRQQRHEVRNSLSFLNKLEDIDVPWGPLGYVTFKRTYSRLLDDNDPSKGNEEYQDAIKRVLAACQNQLKVNFTNDELKQAYTYLMNLKFSVAGRFLWQLGTKTIDRLGLMSLQNCAFTLIDHPIKPFLWIFDVLMLGVGVGFNIQRHNIEKIPPLLDTPVKVTRLDTKDADFIIPDKREGWVSLLEKVLESYFYTGKSFTYSTLLVRGAGTPIKGFGGVASGPEDLCKGIDNIQQILSKRRGQKLTSVDCLDIVNIIASVVVAGNIRRCLPKDSLVHTEKGLIEIQNIKVGDKVLTSNGEYENVNNVFIQGKQKLIKIITQDGEFLCTPNHQMAILETPTTYKWVVAKNLNKEDRLLTTRHVIDGEVTSLPSWCYEKTKNSTTCKDITIPQLDPDMAWFIGLFGGDGYTFPNYKKNGFNAYVALVFGLNEYDIAKKAQEQLKRFGDKLTVKLEKRKNENSYIVHCMSKQLAYYFDKNVKQANSEIIVPEFIKKGTIDIRLGYIAGVMDSDGSIETRPKQVVSTVSKVWISQIQSLCYSCGFETRLKLLKKQVPSREGWQLLHKLVLITKHSKHIVNSIPQLFKKFDIPYGTQFSNGYTHELINKYLRYFPTKTKQLVVDTYEEYNGKVHFCPVSVLNIEEVDGEYETYDISVENKHEFYCNGYLTHNSALIAQGDYDDMEYLNAKRWDLGNIPNWRALSNNSVNCNDISKLPECFWEGYKGNGEPYGLVNIDLCKKIGRIKDGDKYPDPDVEGFNPCAEQNLCEKETCCLAEVFLPNLTSFEEAKEVLKIAYRICKHSLLLDCHHKETKDIVHKNMRMGIGMTGYMMSTEEQKAWLSPLYEFLREYDKKYSKKHGISESIKMTTQKPSGTLSLLAGVTPGAHPGIYPYFIRRIRIASSNTLIDLCKAHNFPMEYQLNFDGTEDRKTMVVSFPCKYPEHTIFAKNMTAIDQLEIVKRLQTEWSDNAVSVTVYYKLEELDAVKQWLKDNYTNNVKSCSFLLHNEHGFKQAPYEEITKEQYEELSAKVIPITRGNINLEEDYSGECANGVCPIK